MYYILTMLAFFGVLGIAYFLIDDQSSRMPLIALLIKPFGLAIKAGAAGIPMIYNTLTGQYIVSVAAAAKTYAAGGLTALAALLGLDLFL